MHSKISINFLGTLIPLFVFVFLSSCHNLKDESITDRTEAPLGFEFMNDSLITLTDLQPCDILVKPNHNWLYGTSLVNGGSGFGHAVLVIEGAFGENAIEVLSRAKIFESQAHQLPDEFQLRLAPGYLEGDDYRWANTNFGESMSGFRYRLRLNLSPTQRDSIIQFVLAQDKDVSNWRSQKFLRSAHLSEDDFFNQVNNKKTWYCSLLVWEAFYAVLGIDLDCNGGLMIYPNDLINSPYFENVPSKNQKRVRF